MNQALFLRTVVTLATLWTSLLPAGEVRLSGMVIPGSPRKLQSLNFKPDVNANVVVYNVVMVENGAARYFIPSKQLADDGLVLDSLNKLESFRISQEKGPRKSMLASVGQFADVEPFDKFGRRSVWLNTAGGKIQVVQGITDITPRTLTLTALKPYHWEYGISTKAVPAETLQLILKHRIDPRDPQLRLQLARFYIQAEMFPQAFHELDAIARDFPDLKERATSVHQGLVQEFGRVVLRELKLRVEAGQHQLAEEYARQIAPNDIGGAVRKDAQDFLKTCDRQRGTMARAGELLDDFAAALSDANTKQKLQPLRSALLEELHPDTLNRLDPFLKSEADNGYSVQEKLALAYSGWIVGAANAVTDLDQAVRLWDARFLTLEALRDPTLNGRETIYQQLRKVEGVGPETVRKLIPQLPPALETPGAESGRVFTVDFEETDQCPATTYSVLLPLEYSPRHTYPLVVTLRAEGRQPAQMLEWWGGTAEQPGLSQRRGYIVIAPEIAPPNQGDYKYDAATHQRVLAAMRDACRRFTIDSDRVYLSGHGLGADAAFDIGFSHPDEFAGVIPICGVCDHYCKHYIDNALDSAWYVVGGEKDRDTSAENIKAFHQIYNKHGYRYDFIFCEFEQRGFENYAEELPRIFEWMSLHRRLPLPKDVKAKTLRKSDNRFFWVVAHDLPRNVVLPQPEGSKTVIKPMKIEAYIAPGTGSGNVINVDSAAKSVTLWIHPDLVDLEKRVVVKLNQQRRHNQFVDPDVAATLEDYRARGDRRRLFLAKLEF